MDLIEMQSEDELNQFRLEIKQEENSKNFSGCFQTRFEKYEYLLNKETLS